MLEGACHCGAVRWTLEGMPPDATACNCTICRRYGTLWAYDYEGEKIGVTGRTRAYSTKGTLGFHFCGTVRLRRLLALAAARGRRPPHLRLAALEAVADIPIEHFDGLATFEDLGRDGRCVRDYWS